MTRLPRRIVSALRSLVLRRKVERELDEELQFHYQQMLDQETARGLGPADAGGRAARRLGGFDQVKEACRDIRPSRPLEQVAQDIRFGVRLLARSPVFTAVAVLSLALGIGANSAIFSLINAILLRELPVAQPRELYIAEVVWRGETRGRFSYPMVEATRAMLGARAMVCGQSNAQSMQVAAATQAPDSAGSPTPTPMPMPAPTQLQAPGSTSGPTSTLTPAPAEVQLLTGDCFALLQQHAQIGRLLGPDDSRTLGQHPVAVISDGYWSRRFGRTPDVLGRTLIINGAPLTIVGVAMPGFFGMEVDTSNPDIWVPVMLQAALRFNGNFSNSNGDPRQPWPPQREIFWLNVMLRIPPGESRDGIVAGVAAITDAMNLTLQREYAQVDGYQADTAMRERLRATRLTLTSGARGFSRMRAELTAPLVVLLAMVGLLLAIACTNLASLLLARAASRHREMAIRLSIGAGRGRLVRQLLTESLLLALMGGGLGLLLAQWASTAFLTFANRGQAATGIDVHPDWRVVAVTLALSVLTALLFGLLPALRSTHVRLAETMNAQARGVIGAAGARGGATVPVGKLLIAAQMAFSLLLLIVAALFARSLQQTMRVDIGVDRDRLVVASLDPRGGGYAREELPALHRRLLARLASVPGVTAASLSANGLFAGSRTTSGFEAEGYTRGRDERLVTSEELVTPDYFRTVGLRIVQGRALGPEDTAQSRKVSVINETMARRYFHGRNPIGQRWGFTSDFGRDGFEIIGVAADARYNEVKVDSLNMAYRPAAQTDSYLHSLEVSTDGDPAALVATVRSVLRESEPRLPVGRIETLNERVTRTLGQDRLMMVLTMAFGVVALALACLGLYGTIAYAVARRTAELGVRMALGASAGMVRWLILREALTLVAIGALVGLPLAFVAARAIAGLLYGVTPADLAAYAGALAALLLIAALAAYLPARRAARLDPTQALRAE